MGSRLREKAKQKSMRARGLVKMWSGHTLKDCNAPQLLAKKAMNHASVEQKLSTAKLTYPSLVVEQTRVKMREEKAEYSYIILKNGEGYKEALVYVKGQRGFWYCVYDCEQGSKVSEHTFYDKHLFQMEYDAGIVRLRYVKVKEPQFIIVEDCRV